MDDIGFRILELQRNSIERSNLRINSLIRSYTFFKFSIIEESQGGRGDYTVVIHTNSTYVPSKISRPPVSSRKTFVFPVHTHRDRAASEWNRVFFGSFSPVKLINKADPFLAHRSLASKLRFCVGRGL